VLRRAGLVQTRRKGSQVMCSIRDDSVFQICELICGGVLRHVREENKALGLSIASNRKLR
jgi:hypothetical protein